MMHRMCVFGLGALAALAVAGPGWAQAPTRLPDLSAYDCRIGAPGAITTVHIGQVIKGRYAEWNEFYLNGADGKPPRLLCISHIVPNARQLSRDDAEAFLTDSLAVGAPTASGLERMRAAPVVERPEPALVEPVKRVRAAAPNSERALSGTTGELPPIPVTRSADGPAVAPTPVLPQRDDAESLGLAPALTVGVEDRAAVTNTGAHPWNTVGYLLVTYPSGASYRCSGTLVSAYVVVTAGHCIHNNNRGGFVSQARFYPGQYQVGSGVVRPYGGKSDWQNLKATQGWIQVSGQDSYLVTEYRNDFAAIQFRTPFTHTATFMPVIYSSTVGPVTNGGYPAVVNGGDTYNPFTQTGAERSTYLRGSHVREFAVDSSGGNSGGPFWIAEAATGRPSLVGSLSYGDELNDRSGGPWYDSWNQALLTDWTRWTPNGVESQNSATGLRMASVFSSAQPDSLSFIRLYNPTTVAGTVAVTLADYVSGNLLGTWTSPSIPAGASLQFSVQSLEAGAGIATPPAFYSLSVRPTFSGYFQHILWRIANGAITDLTTCDAGSTTNPTLLMNVHSSLLQGPYPSTVIVQNTGTQSSIVTLGIYDARNGIRLGAVTTGVLPANAQYIRSIAQIEQAAGIVPTGAMYHYIVRAETSFTGYLQHLLRNVSSGVIADMTPLCQMAAQ